MSPQYQHMPSFGGIKRDCDAIVSELKIQLKTKLSTNDTSPSEMSECVNLLLQLEEPADLLSKVFQPSMLTLVSGLQSCDIESCSVYQNIAESTRGWYQLFVFDNVFE